jgi:hypothetical protein
MRPQVHEHCQVLRFNIPAIHCLYSPLVSSTSSSSRKVPMSRTSALTFSIILQPDCAFDCRFIVDTKYSNLPAWARGKEYVLYSTTLDIVAKLILDLCVSLYPSQVCYQCLSGMNRQCLGLGKIWQVKSSSHMEMRRRCIHSRVFPCAMRPYSCGNGMLETK